jgi:hypothetical protein
MGTNSDPTMQLIRSLDDPRQFVRKSQVSVFKPHVRDFPEIELADGTKIPARRVEVTEKDLREIAENVNRTYQRDGALVVLTVGHRKWDSAANEQTQPLKVGYARNYRAEVVQRPGGPQLVLTHDEYIERDKLAYAKQYPSRSPDYDPDAKTITGVALLLRDPALTTGTVSYSADSRRFTYAMGATMEPDAGMGGGEDWTPDDEVQYAKFCKYMKKYAAEPSATNVAMPGDAPPAPPIEYQKLQAQYQAEVVGRQLDALAYEGVQFVRDVELPKLVAMRETDRGAHFQYMRQTYSKLPVGAPIRIATGVPAPGSKPDPNAPMTEPEFKRALQYQADGKLSWAAARDKVIAERK